MTRLGWTAVGVLYVASVVFSFGAMNAQARAGHYRTLGVVQEYSKAVQDAGFLSLIPIINLACGIGWTGMLADGWTWDRSEQL